MAVTIERRDSGTVEAVTSYEGCVLETREENGYDDSDFYAVVWCDDTQRVIRVDYATTRSWTYNNGAAVDATDEVREKARLFHVEARLNHMQAISERDAKTFAVGKTVAITRTYRSRKLGRTIPDGETGTCFYYGRGFGQPYAEKYGRKPPMRVGVRFSDGELYLDDNDVEVVNWEDYLISDAELRERAEHVGPNASFAWMFSRYSVIL